MINILSKKFPGAETILVVEDEDMLRDMVRSILEGCGYNVLEAESGRKAFDLWQAGADKINLLLTDIVLPRGITGVELAKCLLESQPQLKIIFTTGRILPDFEQDTLARLGAKLLQKPYDQHNLVHLVREVLGGAESNVVTASVA
jgi:two-component system, cell cycle sensor histidine kinase and response regulator CckA